MEKHTSYEAIVLSGGGIKGIHQLGMLHYFFEKGKYDLLDLLVGESGRIESTKNYGLSFLHIAAENGFFATVDRILTAGVSSIRNAPLDAQQPNQPEVRRNPGEMEGAAVATPARCDGRGDQSRATHMAMPMPPPMHKVARPFLASRFCIS